MHVQEDRQRLRNIILTLKASLDDIDLNSLTQVNHSYQHLGKIDDVFIQVQQFKSKWGVNDWLIWGHSLWGDIECNKAALERTLRCIERKEAEKLRKFDRRMSLLSIFLVSVTTISVAITAYISYLSLRATDKVETRKEECEKENAGKQLKTPLNTLPKEEGSATHVGRITPV